MAVAASTVRSVVYGVIGTALAQATLQGLGLWLAGVPAAFFLGFLTFFLSFVPLGPPMVYSAAAWLLYNEAFGWGLFLIGWGFFVVSGVDNVLRPYLISRGSKPPLLLVLFGVLGGLMAFGFLDILRSHPARARLCPVPGVDGRAPARNDRAGRSRRPRPR